MIFDCYLGNVSAVLQGGILGEEVAESEEDGEEGGDEEEEGEEQQPRPAQPGHTAAPLQPQDEEGGGGDEARQPEQGEGEPGIQVVVVGVEVVDVSQAAQQVHRAQQHPEHQVAQGGQRPAAAHPSAQCLFTYSASGPSHLVWRLQRRGLSLHLGVTLVSSRDNNVTLERTEA